MGRLSGERPLESRGLSAEGRDENGDRKRLGRLTIGDRSYKCRWGVKLEQTCGSGFELGEPGRTNGF